MRALERVKAALGRRFGQLLAEDPRRRAWSGLPDATLAEAFHEAQLQAHGGRAQRAFATLLIEHLDHAAGLAPAPAAPPEPRTGDRVDAWGRVHRPDHEHAARERERLARAASAEAAYARAYASAIDAGSDDREAHRAGDRARRDVLGA